MRRKKNKESKSQKEEIKECIFISVIALYSTQNDYSMRRMIRISLLCYMYTRY